ncbi:MAG TPA: hypothetical protein VF797_14010 [Noviherbaspirillum sp.]
MVEQVESGREIRCAPALPFKLGKIQTAEVGSITPAVTRDSASDYEALTVKRNAPRCIKALIKFGFIAKPA